MYSATIFTISRAKTTPVQKHLKHVKTTPILVKQSKNIKKKLRKKLVSKIKELCSASEKAIFFWGGGANRRLRIMLLKYSKWKVTQVHPWMSMNMMNKKEPWRGGLLFESCLCPSSGQPSNQKSDEEDGSLWRRSTPMTDENVQCKSTLILIKRNLLSQQYSF